MEAFSYPIKSQAIVEELGFLGFDFHPDPDNAAGWIVTAPTYISATKARKIISTVISLYETAKELGRAQTRYDGLTMKLESLMNEPTNNEVSI